jgi:nucleoid DNA-binding protein
MIKKEDIINLIAERTDLTKVKAREIFDAIIDVMKEQIVENGEEGVSFGDIGKFKVKRTKERTGKNPLTGKEVLIKAKNKLSFQPSSVIKQELNK